MARTGRWLVGLLLLTAALYAPTLRAGFVYEDPQGLAMIDQPLRVTRGLTTFTWQRVGTDPVVAHGLNVALHLVNGLLVYAVAAQIVAPAALFVSAVALLHPLNSAAVSYVTGRADLLMAFGVLLALWAVLKGGWWRMGLLPALCIAALSKEIGAGAALLVLWTAWVWRPGQVRELSIGLSMVACLAFGYGAATWWEMPAVVGGSALGWHAFLTAQMTALWTLLSLVVWPVGFTIDHDPLAATPVFQTVAVAATFMVIAVAPIAYERRWLPWLWASGFVAISLAPRFLFRSSEFITEVQMYVPMIGISVLAGVVLQRPWSWKGSHGVLSHLPVSPDARA